MSSAKLSGYAAAVEAWSQKIRYMGVGAMVVGGIWALISLAKPLRDGVKSPREIVKKSRLGEGDLRPRTEQDMPINHVLWGVAGLPIPSFLVFTQVIDTTHLSVTSGLYWSTMLVGTLFSLIADFLFASVDGRFFVISGVFLGGSGSVPPSPPQAETSSSPSTIVR